jgi:hypothetical protein
MFQVVRKDGIVLCRGIEREYAAALRRHRFAMGRPEDGTDATLPACESGDMLPSGIFALGAEDPVTGDIGSINLYDAEPGRVGLDKDFTEPAEVASRDSM